MWSHQKNPCFCRETHQSFEEVHDWVVVGVVLLLGFLRLGVAVVGLGSFFLLWTGLYAGALRLRLRLCFWFQVGGVLCTITESQPLRSVWRRRSSYVRTLNRSIETGAQFRPCLCLLGASPTIGLLLTCVSHPSLVDIQQCV